MTPIDSKMVWSRERIFWVYDEIMQSAKNVLGIDGDDLFPNQIEIVTAEQMIDAYASIGLPVHYPHWSFGKEVISTQKSYNAGRQGLALELIINSNPCIQILMEENTMFEQAMVMAHCVGHNFVYKNNVYFNEWTDPDGIIDFMLYAREFITHCEEQYGVEEVEKTLDACHALDGHSVDKYKRKEYNATSEELAFKRLQQDKIETAELDIILKKTLFAVPDTRIDCADAEDNLLYFLMKKSPMATAWQREIMRISLVISQYFYPQTMCKVVHEGMASFCHYMIMEDLEKRGVITSDAFLAFLASHSSVIYQPEYNKPYYNGMNPYAIGFKMFMDLKRAAENPTPEDFEFIPSVCNKDWREVVKNAASDFRDESFISQFLTPTVIREFGLFSVKFDKQNGTTKPTIVTQVQDDIGYKPLRELLAKSMTRIERVPQIVVLNDNYSSTRELELHYSSYNGRGINEKEARSVLEHIDYLWGFNVQLNSK